VDVRAGGRERSCVCYVCVAMGLGVVLAHICKEASL
jgi:hypothetical protein